MEQLISQNGHTVLLRTYDNGTTWQAACECGYRSEPPSEQTMNREAAVQDGTAHANTAPSIRPKVKPKLTPKPKAKRNLPKPKRNRKGRR